ncbi:MULTISPECIES: sensor histidine kinase [unclassified Streptomyces]|uniref:sensor histidine kinase n=1 Tax=unclassified Streptomyces TaxID=2593676 RepID=UPI0033D4C5E2
MRIRPGAADVLVALAQTCVAVLLGREASSQGQPPLDLAGYGLAIVINMACAFRSKAPMGVCLFVIATWTLYIALGNWPVVGSYGGMIACYTVAATRPARISAGCAALLGAVWLFAGFRVGGGSLPSVAVQAIAVPAVIRRFGRVARRSSRLAEQLAREQEARARREVAEERGRMARELHDIIAHHMSVISVQSGLARFVFTSDPATAQGALGTISATSQEALEELRRMLHVLRAEDLDDEPSAPMPGLARLPDMVERLRAGGLPVELRVRGPERTLAPGVDLCAYRVAQEALTNVLKHAPGAATTVEVSYERNHVALAVVNDGTEADPAGNRSGAGHGLIGMRERAKLYGGTITTGPGREGGFEVRLLLPTSARPTV